MRVMAIDFGEKRVGIALGIAPSAAPQAGDAGGAESPGLAVPSRTLERSTDRRLVYTLAALAREEDVAAFLLGEPRDLEGRAGEAAERVRRFAAKLEKASGLPVTLLEETLTTVAAAEKLGGPALPAVGGWPPRRPGSADPAAGGARPRNVHPMTQATQTKATQPKQPKTRRSPMAKFWKFLKTLTILLFVLLLALAGGGFYLYKTWVVPRLEEPYSTATLPLVFEVEQGQSATRIFDDLERLGLLRDARVVRHYFVWVMKEPPLKAGEYQVTRPMTPRELVDKLVRGDVYVKPLKLIEGLTAFEMVDEMVKQGFGQREAFLREIAKVERIRRPRSRRRPTSRATSTPTPTSSPARPARRR